MVQEVGYVHKDFCMLLLVLLAGFLSPVGCSSSQQGVSVPDWVILIVLNVPSCANAVKAAIYTQCRLQSRGPREGFLRRFLWFFFTWNILSWRGGNSCFSF